MSGGAHRAADRHHHDVIVVGVGAMGSAAAYQLAQRGLRVLALERFDIPHAQGSSHGETRIIRLAYSEDPAYVLLLRRAYELWRSIESRAGERLLHITGSVDAGPPGSWVVTGSMRSCAEHDLRHEVLGSAELTARFPGYRLPPETVAVLQPDGGFLLPERCVVAFATAAMAAGAQVHAREAVLGWDTAGDGVRVRTDRGEYTAERLVITAGAWNRTLLPELADLAVPERQVLGWFAPLRPELFTPAAFPVFNLLVDEGRFYGLPQFSVPGFKVGRYHHLGEQGAPELVGHEPGRADEALLADFVRRYFPKAAGATMALRQCWFTNSPDSHFIIDVHPECPQVVFASACSGHGFKFASVIGEVLADLAERGATAHPIEPFGLTRFGTGARHDLAGGRR